MTGIPPIKQTRRNDGNSPPTNRNEVRTSLQGIFEVRTSKVDFLLVLLNKLAWAPCGESF
jgi:hypothetical protein